LLGSFYYLKRDGLNKKKILIKKIMFFLFLFFLNIQSEIFTKKCLKWKDFLKVSCGYIFKDNNNILYADLIWYYENPKILKSIDEFCESCNLKNELFMFELDEAYKIYHENKKIIIKKKEQIFETEEDQSFECFECFLNLYN
jgi:hypothetical protein